MENENKQENISNSKLYRIEELRDQISASVSNLETIIADQTELQSIIEEHARERFKDFLKETAEQLEALKKQKEKLTDKLINVNRILELARNVPSLDNFLTLILDTLVEF